MRAVPVVVVQGGVVAAARRHEVERVAGVRVGGETVVVGEQAAQRAGGLVLAREAAIGGRQCRCGAHGCLEAYIGAESVIARYAEATGGAPDLADAADEESALLRILAAAADGPSPRAKAARAVLDETALHLGVSIGNLINLFNPERIIIGGWAGLLMSHELLPTVREVAREHALRYPFGKATIELGQLGPDAVARGAATLPVARFLDDAGAPGRTGR